MISQAIDSLQNDRFKRWKKLIRKKGRQQAGSFLIEGWSLLQEAQRSGLRVRAIMHLPEQEERVHSWLTSQQLNIPCFVLAKKLFTTLTMTEQPQGVVAEVEMPQYTVADIWSGSPQTHLLLDRVRDPGNLGTIFRSAEAMGASALWLSPTTVDPFNPKVVRSAMGSLFRLPFCIADLNEVIWEMEQRNVLLYVTTPHRAQSLYDVIFPSEIAFLLGNEAQGVEAALQAKGEGLKIPMVGQTESLNVAMTTGILLYERLKQREKQHETVESRDGNRL
jgi:TrmH family RNA methyltransferase